MRGPELGVTTAFSQSTITDRYIHAVQVLFHGAAEKAEERMFGAAG